MLAQVTTGEYLDIHVGGADVRLHAPQSLLDVVDQMCAYVPRAWSGASPPLTIGVHFTSDLWHIGGDAPASRKTLSQNSTLPQLAGAAISSLLAEVAHHRQVSVWRAAVVEHRGRALALVGDDWESAITLAAHLHARGWRMVSGDYALVDLETMRAMPFRKALHVSSAALPQFPLAYRGAIEASPWYSSANAISFYAIDPTIVDGPTAWADGAVIGTVFKVDGRIAERPSLEAGEDFAISETVKRSDLHADVDSAMLVLGGFIESADFIESWFSAPSYAR
jgi:hypothetical protein